MNALEITSPLVSVSWLSTHRDHPDLMILDATIKKVAANTLETYTNLAIKNTRFFDIKGTFSDTSTNIPNMLPSPEVFSEACKVLGINSNHTIIVYDKLGIYSSARVWWMFTSMGHKNVAVLDGGLPAWKNANLPCEEIHNQKTFQRGNFEANYNPKLVVNAAIVHDSILDKNTLILDARSPGRFKAEEPEPRESLKGGHIPNAMNLHYTKLLRDGKMLPIQELKEIFSDYTMEHKKLIFTCGSGITACIIMLAATLCGYKNMSIYDGSWSEWGQLDNAPIQC